MLEVMLCGAEDTDTVRGEFAEVIAQFGGNPLHYQSGRVWHINSSTASWTINSQATVAMADLCVFVIVERYGEITWSVELSEALALGTPFLIFCLSKTYRKYLILSRSIADPTAITDPDERKLVSAVREMESGQQLTITPYESGYFRDELRRQLASTFAQGLALQAARNLRSSVLAELGGRRRVSAADLSVLTQIAVDELEDKNSRKRALSALAKNGGVDEDTLMALLTSSEQGVQRLAMSELAALHGPLPVDPEFLQQCVSIANSSDDIGVVRRLIPALLNLDLAGALEAFDELHLSEVGERRRLAQNLEEFEHALIDQGLQSMAGSLLDRCLEKSNESGWLTRCQAFRHRLGGAAPTS